MSEFWQLETLVEQILLIHTAQKMLPTDLVTFTEEILDGKIHFLCGEIYYLIYLIYCTSNFQLFENQIR